MSNKEKCVICLDKFQTKKKLQCDHNFCTKCIAINLNHSNKCPLCRKKINKYNIFKIIYARVLTKPIEKSNDNIIELTDILRLFITRAEKTKNRNKKLKLINKIYLLIYNNIWYLEEHEVFSDTLIKKLYEYKDKGWRKAPQWISKFKKKINL